MTKARDEIEVLKREWLSDPCWDIENTDGFEDYRDELLAFRLEQEASWKEYWEEYNKHYPLCPLKFAGNNICSCKCEEKLCAWWNSEYGKCGIILTGQLSNGELMPVSIKLMR